MHRLCCGCRKRKSKDAKRSKYMVFEGKCQVSSTSEDKKTIFINLLPLWKGQSRQGVRYAPAILNTLAREVADDDTNIVTHYYQDGQLNTVGDKPEDFPTHMNQLYKKLSEDLSDFKSGDTVVNFGGDHSIAMSTIQKMYHLYPDLRVIWIDAHADINSPRTSVSGNVHGMPVYYISDLSDVHENSSQVPLDNITYFGVRDMDIAEIKILKDNDMRNYTNEELVKRGMSTVFNELIDEKKLLKYPVHISFDIDAIDPSECPSTGTTAPNGLSTKDVIKLCKKIRHTGNLVSFDIVEFNPLIGDEKDVEKTVSSILNVLKEII